ncbi:MAG: Gfo/Idh/MocA family oxidoreductase [Candidatus Eremiobacteraeota bacterium]|nr:Gfo/Idh/MocA family oxidoreductase [Candidatus Eremiobacteraeota bacterium]
MNVHRIGISGAGFGIKAHLPALLAHPDFHVVALASPHTARAVARERDIPHAFSSCAEMIAGCDLDAVVVASPPFTHHDDVLAALNAGKHVMCEKPFALNVAQAQAMLEASLRAGTACGVAHEFRFVPQRAALKEMVANGHLEPLREIEMAHLTRWLGASGTRGRGWWFEREGGGGIAGALLSHAIDSASWTAGRIPKRSRGLLRTANPQRHDRDGEFTSTVDDGAFALIDYGDGAVARLSVDAATAIESFTFAVHGENRTAVASGSGITEMQLFSVDDEETSELECRPSPYKKFESINANVPLLMELYDEFARAIKKETSALPTFAEALETQKVLESVGYTTAGSDL